MTPVTGSVIVIGVSEISKILSEIKAIRDRLTKIVLF